MTQPTDDVERCWYFTFGAAHRGYAQSPNTNTNLGAVKGFRLDDRYVRVWGTYLDARERMHEVFGSVWSHQYDSPQAAAVGQCGLTELVITPDRKTPS
jgi:hypothetical protein